MVIFTLRITWRSGVVGLMPRAPIRWSWLKKSPKHSGDAAANSRNSKRAADATKPTLSLTLNSELKLHLPFAGRIHQTVNSSYNRRSGSN